MAPNRAYVPSRALLRALSRPQPLRCHLTRPIATSFMRGKRTKAQKNEKVEKIRIDPQVLEKLDQDPFKDFKWEDEEWMAEATKPLSEKELEADDIPVISWYEQDLDKGTPRRLVSRIATAEDRKKDREMLLMMEEAEKNPDYDPAHLHRRLIDTLLENPNFANLTEALKEIKADVKTKEEKEAEALQVEKEYEEQSKEFLADLETTSRQAIQQLLDDPDAAAAKEELQEVLDKMPKIEDIDNPEFQVILQKAMSKLNEDPTWQKKVASLPDDESSNKMDELEREWGETINALEEDEAEMAKPLPPKDYTDPEVVKEERREIDELMFQMRDVLKSMGGEDKLQAELDAVLAQDPTEKQAGDFEREMDEEELSQELIKLLHMQAPESKNEQAEEDVSADLQAKVDKIMEDPKLMEKLVYIQNLIEETERAKSDITSIAHEVAPDPYELDDSRTATLKQRMQMARADPEHTAALDRLRVRVPPPFNISPALKSFNQAIEFAYVGANDDIRRVLWRSYQKARVLPTFLQNVSEEAWDILYYSQAVTWGSNQNRYDHLRLLLADLKSLGRDGPPTHPSTLVKSGDGEHLET